MTKQFQGSWFHDSTAWRDTCKELSQDLTNFKRDSRYISIIANDLRDEGVAQSFFFYLKQNYPELLKHINKFKTSDTIGNPNIFNIEGIDISPGTLRFMKVLGDILPLQPKKIIEIGSGYGGQCKIIKDYIDSDYTLVDIPESLNLAKAVLKHFNVQATFVSTDNFEVEGSYDLVISDYCLSELDFTGIKFYIDNIIKKCQSGYFTINSNNEYREFLLNELKEIFSNVTTTDEQPRTTMHNNIIVICKNNILLN
jgi:putative sugar O-methyltransferase